MGLRDKSRKAFRQTGYRIVRRLDRALGRAAPRQVVFVHTPKTGGNSINSYFKEYVGSKRSGRVVRYDDFGPQHTDEFAVRAARAGYVMGHMPWTALELFRTPDTFAFTVLRDPFERLRSLYYYIVNLPASYPREESVNWIQTLTLREFISSRDERVLVHTENYVMRQFSGDLRALSPRSDMPGSVATAIRNLSTLDLVGFNDDIDAVFARVTEIADLPRPPLGRRVNVTADLSSSATGRVAARQPFDDEMRALAAPLVEGDLMIYDHFNKLRGKS